MAITLGDNPAATLTLFAKATDRPAPSRPFSVKTGEAAVWSHPWTATPLKFRIEPCKQDRRRHRRKYAEGELPPDRSFYFRGPEGKLNLRAQNLVLFVQIADGVDDATWQHHVHRGDISRWFRDAIKDETLAEEAARIERRADLSPVESRKLIRAAIEQHYTLPPLSA